MVDRLTDAIQRAGFEQFEVFVEEIDEDSIRFRANRFHQSKRRLRCGYGVRVIRSRRIGFLSGTDPDLLIDALPTLRPTIETKISLPPGQSYRQVELHSDRVRGYTHQTLTGFGSEVIDRLIEIEPELKVDAKVVRQRKQITIRNSNGLSAQYDKLIAYLWVEGQLIHNNHIHYIYDFSNLSSGRPFNSDQILQYFQMVLKYLRREIKIRSGRYPTLILPLALSSLLSSLAPGVSGKALEKGYSPLIGKVGERVLSEKITIYDDGLMPHAFGSSPFDGEGVPKRRLTLFDRGRFLQFIFDLETGVRNNAQSTGNGQRRYTSLPSPGLNNLHILSGKGDLGKTLSNLKEAILVVGVVGGGHGNIYAGDFSVKLDLAFLIRNGEILGRITDVMMAGNIYEMLKGVVEIGNYTKDLGNERLPWILLEGLNFATAQTDPPPR